MADAGDLLLAQFYAATAKHSRGGLPPTKAPRVVTLPPSAFIDTWENRPLEPTQIGLRIVSEASMLAEQRSAFDDTKGITDEEIVTQVMNSQAITGILSSALCKPNDATASWFDTPGGRHIIRNYFSSAAIKRLWEEYELLDVMLSPISEQADDVVIATIADMVGDDCIFDSLSDEQEARVRRCFSMIWDTIYQPTDET